LQRKMKEEEEMEEREKVCSSGHKLNIKDGFIDGFKFIGNFICKNDTSSYFLAFFYSLFSYCNSLGIYYDDIFSRKNSL